MSHDPSHGDGFEAAEARTSRAGVVVGIAAVLVSGAAAAYFAVRYLESIDRQQEVEDDAYYARERRNMEMIENLPVNESFATRFVAHLKAKRFDQAYAMTTTDFRSRYDRATFDELFGNNPAWGYRVEFQALNFDPPEDCPGDQFIYSIRGPDRILGQIVLTIVQVEGEPAIADIVMPESLPSPGK